MPLRRISSILTFGHKFILPAFFALGLLNMLIWGPRYLGPDLENEFIWPYLIVLAFEILTLLMFARVKRVLLDEKGGRLYVSNYRREIAIPFSEIANVTEFRFSDPRRITIHLHQPTEFGQKIVFLATYRFGGWLAGRHPIVDELLTLAARQ